MDEIVMLWRRNRIRSGAQLRSLRLAAGLTQLELAARSGITHEAISRLELGTRSPRSATIRRLSTALGIEPAVLVGKPKTPDA
jgi:transcriptional regulator with XRE-family HTH domain